MNINEEILLTVTQSKDVESTSYPIWFIFDPRQMFVVDEPAQLAQMVTGPFFSRKSAENTLKNHRYNYGKNAMVWCHSGCYSEDWIKLYNASLELRKSQPETFV